MTIKDETVRYSRSQRYWEKHHEAFRESGLNRAEFCRRQSLPYHAFTYWQKKLERNKASSSQLIPVPMGLINNIDTSQSPGHPRRTIRVISGNLAVEVEDGFSQTTLGRVLAVLESR